MFAELRRTLLPPLGCLTPPCAAIGCVCCSFRHLGGHVSPLAAAFRWPTECERCSRIASLADLPHSGYPMPYLHLKLTHDSAPLLKEPMYKGATSSQIKPSSSRVQAQRSPFVDAFSILPLEFIVFLIPPSGLEAAVCSEGCPPQTPSYFALTGSSRVPRASISWALHHDVVTPGGLCFTVRHRLS